MKYGALAAGTFLAVAGVVARPDAALACGGCFGPVDTQQVVTDHRMVMAVHANESILWDQIKYTGDPSEFSWVLPVAGDVQVELASGDFFSLLDQSTAVTVRSPPLNTTCPTAPGFAGGAPSRDNAGASDAGSGVMVIHEAVVGPYETVTLRATDPNALTDWLRAHNYAVPTAIEPVIQFYNDRHMDFVALRLLPGEGVDQMQPVRIRYATANMVLPLRMVAAGVGDKVGISLWVFGAGRFESANFANGLINADDLVWNWDTSRSNYQDVFAATQGALANGRAWITEYAQDAGGLSYQFRYYGNSYPPVYDAGVSDGGAPTVMDDWELATQNDAPGTWVTKLRTDLLARFLDSDLQLQASASSVQVSNFLQVAVGHEAGTRPSSPCPGGRDTPVVIAGGGFACSASPAGRTTDAHGAGLLAGLLAAGLGAAVAWRRRR